MTGMGVCGKVLLLLLLLLLLFLLLREQVATEYPDWGVPVGSPTAKYRPHPKRRKKDVLVFELVVLLELLLLLLVAWLADETLRDDETLGVEGLRLLASGGLVLLRMALSRPRDALREVPRPREEDA